MINNQIDSQNTSAVLKQAIAGAQELDTTTQHLQENRTMKLRFLGQTYSASNYQVDTVASEHTARFFGTKLYYSSSDTNL